VLPDRNIDRADAGHGARLDAQAQAFFSWEILRGGRIIRRIDPSRYPAGQPLKTALSPEDSSMEDPFGSRTFQRIHACRNAQEIGEPPPADSRNPQSVSDVPEVMPVEGE
jgi:hypothetical protein